MMERLFTAPDAWSGGSFEILMFLGRVDRLRVRNLLAALWGLPSLEGCWRDGNAEPEAGTRRYPSAGELESGGVLRGLAELPNGCRCPCSSAVVTDDDGSWVYFGMPLGSLGRCYPVGAYPFEDATDRSWVGSLSEWLADIGRGVYSAMPFRAAVTGFLTTMEVDEIRGITSGEIPTAKWNGYLRPEATGLAWYPPNAGPAPLRLG
jgi:hypothetical protein